MIQIARRRVFEVLTVDVCSDSIENRQLPQEDNWHVPRLCEVGECYDPAKMLSTTPGGVQQLPRTFYLEQAHEIGKEYIFRSHPKIEHHAEKLRAGCLEALKSN